MSKPRNIAILGATGSIGGSVLRVVRQHPEKLSVTGVSAHRAAPELAAIAAEFGVPYAVLSNGEGNDDRATPTFPDTTDVARGESALHDLVSRPEVDVVVVALVGAAGLLPTLAAIDAGKTVVLANKEVMVMAGDLVMQRAREKGVPILPADSEHNAIFQCLHAGPNANREVEKVILTASGGPFRQWPLEKMRNITPEEALRHPNWDMGPKNSLDSATMANKGLELIEARWFFDLRPEQLAVAVHPQSIIHGMVQYRDGSVIAQLCPTDMTYPLQHCLLFPQRCTPAVPTIDWSEALTLHLEPPDLERFPCLQLALRSLQIGKAAPCIYNAANEVAGEAFLKGSIPFLKIPWIIDKTLESSSIDPLTSLEHICSVDLAARQTAKSLIQNLS